MGRRQRPKGLPRPGERGSQPRSREEAAAGSTPERSPALHSGPQTCSSVAAQLSGEGQKPVPSTTWAPGVQAGRVMGGVRLDGGPKSPEWAVPLPPPSSSFLPATLPVLSTSPPSPRPLSHLHFHSSFPLTQLTQPLLCHGQGWREPRWLRLSPCPSSEPSLCGE